MITSLINDKADEIIKVIFKSLCYRYQIDMEDSVKGSDVAFDYFDLVRYKYHKINLNCSGSYLNSPFWIRNKKTKTNPINIHDNKSVQ